MSFIVPNIDWYTNKSQERGNSQLHCPFATVEACPRYYQSLSLSGEAGSTKIEKVEDERLLKMWEKHDLWPRTKEQATSISGPKGSPKTFDRFCPEVSFERFGYFASDLSRHTDELDREAAHKQISQEPPVSDDYRSVWAYVHEMHYTDCTLYSVLSHRNNNVQPFKGPVKEPWYKKPLGIVFLGVIIIILGSLIRGLF